MFLRKEPLRTSKKMEIQIEETKLLVKILDEIINQGYDLYNIFEGTEDFKAYIHWNSKVPPRYRLESNGSFTEDMCHLSMELCCKDFHDKVERLISENEGNLFEYRNDIIQCLFRELEGLRTKTKQIGKWKVMLFSRNVDARLLKKIYNYL